MNNLELDENKINNLLIEVLNENKLDYNNINLKKFKYILLEHKKYYNQLQLLKPNIKIDTFKIVSHLMITIYDFKLFDEEKINATIAVDTALKFCEESFNHQIIFKKIFSDDIESYNNCREKLIESLIRKDNLTINYPLIFEILYQMAILKTQTIDSIKVNKKKKIFNIFKKFTKKY